MRTMKSLVSAAALAGAAVLAFAAPAQAFSAGHGHDDDHHGGRPGNNGRPNVTCIQDTSNAIDQAATVITDTLDNILSGNSASNEATINNVQSCGNDED